MELVERRDIIAVEPMDVAQALALFGKSWEIRRTRTLLS